MAGMWSLPAGSYQSTTSPPPAGSVVSRARVGGEHRDANGAGGGRRPGGGAGGVDGLPEPPASLADIERMPLAELQSIAGDPAKFDHYISSHQHTRQVEATLTTLRREVEALEEAKRKRDAVRFAESSQGVSSAELAALTAQVSGAQARVAALQKEREDWVSRNTEHHLEQRLRGLIEETERESEDLLGAWNDGVMEYAEFMAKYLGVRTKLAERKLKLDTFQEKLLQARLAAGASPSRG